MHKRKKLLGKELLTKESIFPYSKCYDNSINVSKIILENKNFVINTKYIIRGGD